MRMLGDFGNPDEGLERRALIGRPVTQRQPREPCLYSRLFASPSRGGD